MSFLSRIKELGKSQDREEFQPGQSPGAANGRVGPLGLDGGRIPQVGAGGTAIVGAQSLKQGEVGVRRGVEHHQVGAGALITEGTVVPPKSLILGSPAKVKRSVTEQELAWIRESAQNYIRYSRQYLSGPDKLRPGFWV